MQYSVYKIRLNRFHYAFIQFHYAFETISLCVKEGTLPFFLSKFVELYKNIPPFVEKTSFRKLWSFFIPRDKKYPCWDVTRPTPYYISYLFYIVKQKIVTIFYTVYIIKNIVYNEHRWLYIYCIKYIVYKGHTLYLLYCIYYS